MSIESSQPVNHLHVFTPVLTYGETEAPGRENARVRSPIRMLADRCNLVYLTPTPTATLYTSWIGENLPQEEKPPSIRKMDGGMLGGD